MRAPRRSGGGARVALALAAVSAALLLGTAHVAAGSRGLGSLQAISEALTGVTAPARRELDGAAQLAACVAAVLAGADDGLGGAPRAAALDRVAVLDAGGVDDDGGDVRNASVDADPPFATTVAVLLDAGWDVAVLREDARDSLAAVWRARFAAWRARANSGDGTAAAAAGSGAGRRAFLAPVSPACAAFFGRPLLGVLAASRAGADTVLWLRHWRGNATLAEWPRYYAPSAALPAPADAVVDGGVRLVRHFFNASGGPPAGGTRAAVGGDLRLCTNASTFPLLQLGLCAGDGVGDSGADDRGTPLTEAPGVVLPHDAAPAAAAAATNVLAYRPAFGALAALAAAAGPSGAAATRAEAAALLRATVAALGRVGYATALLAPGSLCGDPAPRAPQWAGPPPDLVREPQVPPVDRGCLLHGCDDDDGGGGGNASAAFAPSVAGSVTQTATPPAPARAGGRGTSTAALLADVARGAAADGPPALLPLLPVLGHGWAAAAGAPPCADAGADAAGGAPAAGCAAAPPPVAYAPRRLVRGDAGRATSFPGACFASRPWLRDIALAVVFNHGVHAQPALLSALRGLYDASFTTVFFMSSAPDAPALGRLQCSTGVGGNDAHVCMARAAPLAFGRVGLMWAMDDALLAPWRYAAFDARRLWFVQGQTGLAGNLGPSANYAEEAIMSVTSNTVLAAHVAWSRRPGVVSPAMTAMRARNAAALGRGVELARGTTDAFYVPRSLLQRWGVACGQSAGLYVMQEILLPSLALATAYGPHNVVLNIRSFPRGAGATRGDPRLVVACALWSPDNCVTHPWKMGSEPAAAAHAVAMFGAWHATGAAPVPPPATLPKAECAE